MSRLEKLMIQGLRSFGPEDTDRQLIDFIAGGEVSPLTLILGQNGCGKTTIIECLKYVATGDFPPGSSKGQSFVHDPKMARENQVCGTVKLQFKAIDGDRMVLTRSVEATQKAKSIQVKTLDSTMTKKGEGGKPVSLSMKCADINAHMLLKMGVSRPILNYVIFCHQEDSNWPLDESSKLKEKFDDIFSSTKYKNCLNKIKDVRKEHMGQKKIEEKELEYLQNDKQLVADKRKDLRRKESQKAVLSDQLQEIERQMEPVTKQLEDIREVEINFVGIQEKIASAKTSLTHCENEVQDLRSSLEFEIPPETSDGEIEKMKRQIEAEKDQKESEIRRKKKDLEQIGQKIRKDEVEGQKISARIGELKAHHDRNVQNRNELARMLTSTGSDLGWSERDYSDRDEVDDAMKKLSQNVNDKKSEVKLAEDEANVRVDQCQKRINELEIEKAQLEEQKKMKQTEFMKNKKEIASLLRMLRELEGSENKLQAITRKFDVKEKELKEEEESVDLKALQKDIERKRRELKDLEKKDISLKEEKDGLEALRTLLSQIEMKKEDRDEKKRKLDRIMNKKRSELTQFFGGASSVPALEQLKTRFTDRVETITAEKKELESEKLKLSTERETKRQLRKTLQREVAAKEEKIRAFESKVRDVIDSDKDIEEELDKTRLEVERTSVELQVKEANKFTYKEFLERIESSTKAGAKASCPTCNREFKRSAEVDELVNDLQDEIKKIPQKVGSIQKKLEGARKRMDKLRDLLPEERQNNELKREVGEKQKDLTKLDSDLKGLEEKLSSVEDRSFAMDTDYSFIDDLREDVLNLDRLNIDVRNANEVIEELERKTPGNISQRNFESVKDEYETNLVLISGLREDIECERNREMTHEKRINELEREKNRLLGEKLEIEKKQQERSNTEKRKKELEESVKTVDADVKKIESELRPLQDSIDDALAARSRAITDKENLLEGLRRKLDQLKNVQNKLGALLESITRYESMENDKKLDGLKRDYKENTEKKQKLEAEKEELEGDVRDLEKSLSNQNQRRRNIDDNIRLRGYLDKERKQKEVISKCEHQLEVLDYRSIKTKKDGLLKDLDRLNADKNSKTGRMDEMKISIREIERDLNKEQFRLAEKRYKEKKVMCQLRAHAIDDLNKYYKALDCAIMNFHKDRMRVINKIIRELWRATYKGNDIDYIEIRTDEEGAVSAGADKRRAYNYKVLMVKNDTEMDMRGRCSAGQKVLASLIIRLALAETFSANCGVIALDEPTTNLDRENIMALAEALGDIVQRKSRQQNFQLIVITHDEDLVSHLSRSDQVRHYYKVSRNERGKSQIRKHSVEGPYGDA